MTQIKLRRDTSANFASANPVLGVGEPAYETDTKKLKIGDGTTAYTQLEYFTAGGGGSTNISATLPLKIVDGVISLEVDGQTIQIVDGKLHANLDELGNEVNTLAGDVAGVQADLLNKQDKFETQVPLSISSNSGTTSVAAGITDTAESWTGGGPDKLVTVNVSRLNIDANSDWKIHLSGYMGNYKSTATNTNVLLITTENETIFRVWFGSQDFRLGNGTSKFYKIPNTDREFYYEIVHQKNSTEFTFNGGNLVDIDPLPIQAMFEALGSGNYRTLAGRGKLKDFSFLINTYQFRRIDKDISKSYFEANGVKYPITSVKGTNTLNLNIGSGLAITDGKLTASSTAPANMMTTDTAQTISGQKEFNKALLFLSSGDLIRSQQNSSYRNGAGLSMGANSTSTDGGVFAPQWKIYNTSGDVDRTETIITTYNQSKLNSSNFNTANKLVRLDSDGKLPAIDGSNLTNLPSGGSTPTNMVTTDTNQTITGLKTFGGTDLSKILLEGSKSVIGFRQNSDSLPTTLIGGFFDSNGKKSISIGSTDHETLSLNAKSVQDGSGNKFLTSGNVTAYVTEEFVDGTEGYRVWSNGRCEQWGRYSLNSSTGEQHLTFLKEYKDTNYLVLIAKTSADASAWNVMLGPITDWSTSGLLIKANLTGYVLRGPWYVSGMLAS